MCALSVHNGENGNLALDSAQLMAIILRLQQLGPEKYFRPTAR